MASLSEVQRKWVDEFLETTGRRSGGVPTSGIKAVIPGAALGQDDSLNDSRRRIDTDATVFMAGHVSADSSMSDEAMGNVKVILVEMTPPPNVNLPTLHGSVELVSDDLKSTQQVPRKEVLNKPEYVDNFTKATLKVPIAWDMKDASKLTLNLYYSSGNPVGLQWPLLLFQWEQPAYKYGRQFGKIVPYAPDGNALFDKNNTPSLILAALFFKEELDKLAEEYLQIAEIVYTTGGAVASSAGQLGSMRVGSFSGGRYGKSPRSGSKGGGTAGKPPTGSGTGRTGTTQRTNTGGGPTGGAGTTGKPTSGDGNAPTTTPMRLPDPKGPARRGSGAPTSGRTEAPKGGGADGKGGSGGTGKPGGGDSSAKGGGSGEKGRTPIKADNAKGHADDGDPGKAAGKKRDPSKTDKTNAGEGRSVKVTSGSKDSKEDGAKGDSKPTATIKPSGSGSVIRRTPAPRAGGDNSTTETATRSPGATGTPKPATSTTPPGKSPSAPGSTPAPTPGKGPAKPATTTTPAGKSPPKAATTAPPTAGRTPPKPVSTPTPATGKSPPAPTSTTPPDAGTSTPAPASTAPPATGKSPPAPGSTPAPAKGTKAPTTAPPPLMSDDELKQPIPLSQSAKGHDVKPQRLNAVEFANAKKALEVLAELKEGRITQQDVAQRLPNLRVHLNTKSKEWNGWYGIDLVEGNPGWANTMRIYYRGSGSRFQFRVRQGH